MAKLHYKTRFNHSLLDIDLKAWIKIVPEDSKLSCQRS